MPWPGPQEIFFILTREEFLTMEMQSSPEMEHNMLNFPRDHYIFPDE